MTNTWSVEKSYPEGNWILRKDGECQHNFQHHNGSPQSARQKCERELAQTLARELYQDRPETAYRIAYLTMSLVEESGNIIAVVEQVPRSG